jgi:hypothetical protein
MGLDQLVRRLASARLAELDLLEPLVEPLVEQQLVQSVRAHRALGRSRRLVHELGQTRAGRQVLELQLEEQLGAQLASSLA